jgi:hypothetical protein
MSGKPDGPLLAVRLCRPVAEDPLALLRVRGLLVRLCRDCSSPVWVDGSFEAPVTEPYEEVYVCNDCAVADPRLAWALHTLRTQCPN